jgi:putative intracellular protease/amidase
MAKKVLLVSTSAGQMGEHPTGLWISELAEPYTVFTKAGLDVTIASIAGGAVPICA